MAMHGDPEVVRIFKMLDPKPKTLVAAGRRLLREGEVLQYNQKERRPKLKYFFLFNDVLLITKREGPKKFWLKVYITLQPSLKVADVPDSAYRVPNVEFRLFAPRRTFIFFCKNQSSKDDWIRSLRSCIEGKPRAGGHASSPAPSSASHPSHSTAPRYDPTTGHRHTDTAHHPSSRPSAASKISHEPNYEELYYAEKAKQGMDSPEPEGTDSGLLRLAAGMDDMSMSSSSGRKVAVFDEFDAPGEAPAQDFSAIRFDDTHQPPAFDLLWGNDSSSSPQHAPSSLGTSPGMLATSPGAGLFAGVPSAPAGGAVGGFQFPGAPTPAPAGQFQFPGAPVAAAGAGFQFPSAGGAVPAGQFQFPAAGAPATAGQFQFPAATPVGGVGVGAGGFQFPAAGTPSPAPGQFQFPVAGVGAAPGGFQYPSAGGVAPSPAAGQFQFPGGAVPAAGFQFPPAAAGGVPTGQFQYPATGMPAVGAQFFPPPVGAAPAGQFQFPAAGAVGVGAAPAGQFQFQLAPAKARPAAPESAAKDPFADLVSFK